jgi:hypothetical protein
LLQPCAGSTEPPATAPPARVPSRVPSAELLSRVFKVDVLKRENCGGLMTVLAFLTERAKVFQDLLHRVPLGQEGEHGSRRDAPPSVTAKRTRSRRKPVPRGADGRIALAHLTRGKPHSHNIATEGGGLQSGRFSWTAGL